MWSMGPEPAPRLSPASSAPMRYDFAAEMCIRDRVNADAGDGAAIGEWTVRSIMEEENLVARAARKKRRYSSYEGEISEAPENLLRDDRGRHHFRSNKPNELWITDVTEFRIPAGKVYLSPIVDCFDGMPLSWSISTSPDAEMANSSLLGACKWLGEGDHPKIHSDRGCHYRWPGWIRICDENGLVRSMSRKGCSPDAVSYTHLDVYKRQARRRARYLRRHHGA